MFRIIPGGRDFSEYVLLRDGESILLRTATMADIPAVDALMKLVSRESLRMRFMGSIAWVSRSFAEFTCTGEARERLCLIALAGREPGSPVVGIGNYIATGAGGKAEVAFLVLDEFQGRGISTLILERLAGIAAGNGFTGFEAEVLSENQAMINVFRDSGFDIQQSAVGGGSIHLEFPVGGAAAMRERAELRDRLAAANSLVPLLQPRSVAIIGASRDPDSVGSLIFRSILRGNFHGEVSPVNNQATSIQGVRAYASVRDLPVAPDLVVIAIPAADVLDAAGEALRAGARALLVLTSGFADSGSDGAARQRLLVELARSHGARLVGPNCLGLMNTDPEVRLNASLAPSMAPRGRIGFFSHSGALGLVILSYAEERGLGFSSFVSAGNRADVSGNDLLQFWEEDTSTDMALLYLETFGNPRRFARIARRISHRKPILCVKSARSRAGLDVARSHVGDDAAGGSNLAESETNVESLFRQAGVIRADTLEEMFDVAVLLANQPLPRGNRVAILSNSGGALTICADACEARGLDLAGPGLVDLGALADAPSYEAAVRQAAEHPSVDALIVIFACIGGCDPRAVGRAIRRGVLRAEAASGEAKPALLCLMGAAGAIHFGNAENKRSMATRHVFPSYRFPESAALALSRAVQYSAFRSRPVGRLPWYEDVNAASARLAVSGALPSAAGKTVWFEGERAGSLLRFFGIAPDPGEPPGPPESSGVVLEILSDRSFGPLIRLRGGAVPAVVRITPLTDRDIEEIVAGAGLPRESEELLGRVSQLIEELPWLHELTGTIERAASATPADRMVLGRDARIGFLAPPALSPQT
ncbi:MAG: GNAT family N-acetyltransferase [Thermoanaerobaculia bacterium]